MTIGFIGLGNMASAIIGGILQNRLVAPEDIVGADRAQAARDAAAEKGVRTADSNIDVVRQANVILLAVKPNVMAGVIEEIRGEVTEDKLFISIAAGKSIAWIEGQFAGGSVPEEASGDCGCGAGKEAGGDAAVPRFIRFMPNMPAQVQAGCTAVCRGTKATDEDVATALMIARSFGTAEVVPESLIDTFSAVASCSPAYVFMFIEAMADAGVRGGMPRAQAYRFAAQAVMGSAKLVLETGRHPAQLTDMVTSPGGTTIEGLQVLEEDGFRGTVMDAIAAAIDKAKEL